MSPEVWSERDVRSTLEDIYRQTIRRIDAGAALRRALDEADYGYSASISLLAVGKAAPSMAAAALAWLDDRGAAPARTLIVGPANAPGAAGQEVVAGDHPVPADGSLAASQAVAEFVDQVPPGGTVWLLLSGGASSLMAGPVDGVSPDDLATLFGELHSAALDIHAMNSVRKRFLRWGAGRLAAALAPAPCHAYLVSDVPGDAIPDIGSGPVSPDDSTMADVKGILDRAGLLDRLPPTLQANIAEVTAGQVPETPKPADAIFDSVEVTVISSNRDAVSAARQYGIDRHWNVPPAGQFLTGEAAEAGSGLARELVRAVGQTRDTPSLLVWGGETVVSLGPPPHQSGGRCQELALAAARELSVGADSVIGLLAAGTDGRDGPTDAAGAIVTRGTWTAMELAGAEPARALSRHASYAALGSVDALFIPGLTGTNVMDIVLGIVAPGVRA